MDIYQLWCQQDEKLFPIRLKCGDEVEVMIDLITAVNNSKLLAEYFSIDPQCKFISLEAANIDSESLRRIIKLWYTNDYEQVNVHTLSDIVKIADYLRDEKTIKGVSAQVNTRPDLASTAWATAEYLNIMELKLACLAEPSRTHFMSGFWAEVGRLVDKSPSDVKNALPIKIVSDHIAHGFI